MPKIKRFWTVTRPNELSGLDDIVFSSYLGREKPNVESYDLANQFRGGLGWDEIDSIYNFKEEAEERGRELLAARGKE